MMKRKLVLIGAGSVSFTRSVIINLLEDTQREWTVALVDIEPVALEAAYKLCRKILREQGSGIELTKTVDRCEALPGADYVVTTIGVGGRVSWEQDVVIPRKYGIFQPVGDTAMPGGISRAMRMIPAMLAITRDVQRLCPQAKFFNYSNPMSTICRAVRKATGAEIVGLCHGVFMMEWYLADFVGKPREECTSLYAGINHLTYMYDFRHQGVDQFPAMHKKLAEIEAAGWDFSDITKPLPKDAAKILEFPFCWTVFRECGAFPAPGDYHVIEFYPERFPGGRIYGGTMGVDVPIRFEDFIEGGDREFDSMKEWAELEGKLPEEAYHVHVREKLLDMIDSMEGDKRAIFPVNVPNNGAVPNLPDHAILEIPAVAAHCGVCPIQLRNFPDHIAAMVAKQLAIIEVTVDAALQGNRNLFIEAIMLGGYIQDKTQVERMVDELIQAQKPYLPQF